MFLLVDKPLGWSSFKVVHKVRKALAVKKVGHAGTLDPLASGLLLIAVGTSTKLLSYIFGLDKTYIVTAVFGLKSPTYDFEKDVVLTNSPELPSQTAVEKALDFFRGEIWHTPPPFSAIKIAGEKAYERARRGENIEISPRKTRISGFDLIKWHEVVFAGCKLPAADFVIRCAKGTYIRSLVHELGEKLGCGAVVYGLRRSAIGNFKVDDERVLSGDFFNQEDVREKVGRFSVANFEMFADFPRVDLPRAAVETLKKGKFLPIKSELFLQSGLVIGVCEGQMAAILRVQGRLLMKEKMV